MQPLSHDAYKRDGASQLWAGNAQARPAVDAEQEDQWAILRQEVEEGGTQRMEEPARSDWDRRDTDEERISSLSSLDELVQATHNVDIVVAGVGGGGMNAVNRMIDTHVRGVRYIAMNTDAQVLALSQASQRICLGQHHTKGLGAGGIAAVGMRAATESAAEIRAALGDADLVFIAAGLGGGTGTGAAPVIASIAKKLGALTVGIVTLPFTFEGTRRRRVAEQGLADLKAEIDALITVPNDRLLTTVARECNLSEAFKVADDVLRQGVQGIAEVINVPGMVNVDFADVRSVLRESGTALMSIGQGRGRNRAQQAAEEAIAGGFLNVTIRGAQRVLFNISGGEDMTLFEVNEVAERIGEAVDSAADITFGAVIDPSLSDMLRVTLIAAGMEGSLPGQSESQRSERPRTFAPGATSTTPALPPLSPRASRVPGTPSPATPSQLPPVRQSRQPSPPLRQQRPLNDQRSNNRSLGQRRDVRGDDDDAIDIPPFMKR